MMPILFRSFFLFQGPPTRAVQYIYTHTYTHTDTHRQTQTHRHRHRHAHRHTQTHRHTHTQTDRQTNARTRTHAHGANLISSPFSYFKARQLAQYNIYTYMHTHRDRETHTQTETQTQTDRQSDTHTHGANLISSPFSCFKARQLAQYKQRYLGAILRQDVGWFDTSNPQVRRAVSRRVHPILGFW